MRDNSEILAVRLKLLTSNAAGDYLNVGLLWSPLITLTVSPYKRMWNIHSQT